jgi:hypothetical protein
MSFDHKNEDDKLAVAASSATCEGCRSLADRARVHNEICRRREMKCSVLTIALVGVTLAHLLWI